MNSLPQRDIQSIFRAIRSLQALRSLEDISSSVLRILQKLVSVEYLSYNQFNHRNNHQIKVLESIHQAAEKKTDYKHLEFFNRYVFQHPINTCNKINQAGAFKISDNLSQRDFQKLDLYNEYYRYKGVNYQIYFTIPLTGVRNCFAFNRSQKDFSERDRLILNCIQPYLLRAYQNAEIVTKYQKEVSLLQAGLAAESLGMIQLAKDGVILSITPVAQKHLTEYCGSSAKIVNRLPDKVHQWFLGQQATWMSPSHINILTLDQGEKRLVFQLLIDQRSESLLLIVKEEQSRSGLSSDSLKKFGLSSRETEVLFWVAKGKSNKEIGIVLTLSPRTVQKHLEEIYRKLSVSNRTEATAVALGF